MSRVSALQIRPALASVLHLAVRVARRQPLPAPRRLDWEALKVQSRVVQTEGGSTRFDISLKRPEQGIGHWLQVEVDPSLGKVELTRQDPPPPLPYRKKRRWRQFESLADRPRATIANSSRPLRSQELVALEAVLRSQVPALEKKHQRDQLHLAPYVGLGGYLRDLGLRVEATNQAYQVIRALARPDTFRSTTPPPGTWRGSP